MISVLCPTRGRPDSLEFSLRSLLTEASDPGAVQMLIACDPDEEAQTKSVCVRLGLAGARRLRLWTAPERYGYRRLHEYYNALASYADGGWLLLWNDDAVMKTQGWDTIIQEHQAGILWLQANHSAGGNLFPAWPKAWADATGHVSLSPHCDTWLQAIGQRLGCMYRVPIEVFHDRWDVTGGHDDATYAEGRALIGSDMCVPEHDTPEAEMARERDAGIIARQFLQRR